MLKRVPNRGLFVVELLCCSPSQYCCITALNFADYQCCDHYLATWPSVSVWTAAQMADCAQRELDRTVGLPVELLHWGSYTFMNLWWVTFYWGKEQEAGEKVMGLWLRGKSIQTLLHLQGCPKKITNNRNYDTRPISNNPSYWVFDPQLYDLFHGAQNRVLKSLR